jgi:hypothetical protein
VRALKSVYRLLDALESGEDSLETGKPVERAPKRHMALLELMDEALAPEDAGDMLELLEFVRRYGAKMRRDLKREMMSDSYFPSPSVLARMKRREAEEMARQASEDAKGLLDRDKRRIDAIGPMLPFLKPGRVKHGVDEQTE